MRAVLFILIVAVLVLLAGVATGFINIDQIRGTKVPQITATHNGVQAKGGQAPAFDVQTGSVEIGTKSANVTVPDLKVVPPTNQAAQNVANAQ
jgi:hypothetical protein